jgi:hypothetical protein
MLILPKSSKNKSQDDEQNYESPITNPEAKLESA